MVGRSLHPVTSSYGEPVQPVARSMLTNEGSLDRELIGVARHEGVYLLHGGLVHNCVARYGPSPYCRHHVYASALCMRPHTHTTTLTHLLPLLSVKRDNSERYSFQRRIDDQAMVTGRNCSNIAAISRCKTPVVCALPQPPCTRTVMPRKFRQTISPPPAT